MSLGNWLQVVGGSFELLGLLVVAVGIGETRRAFTDRPSLLGGLHSLIRRVTARFRRKRIQVIAVSGVGSLETAGRGRAVVKLGSWDSVATEQKLTQLRNMAERHEDMLACLDEQLGVETEERKSGDKQESRQREELRQLLEARIREAAAGGLRLQVVGVVAFAAGVVFATWGSLIS